MKYVYTWSRSLGVMIQLQNNHVMSCLYLCYFQSTQVVPKYVLIIAWDWNARILTDEVSLMLGISKGIFCINAWWYFDKFICKHKANACSCAQDLTQGFYFSFPWIHRHSFQVFHFLHFSPLINYCLSLFPYSLPSNQVEYVNEAINIQKHSISKINLFCL